ncbi:serine/arginine repetitive matrix protein 2-like [Cololabis saira]|uniref:serine/arginine repetitive matrix protein 2-like n=1 Tax=Cololabis saira TaxID=129043 RepID=UPI002AD2DF1F|nr:serine/arginine repetitive matrix protein 2-like [Cololabis saira]
MGEDGVSMCHEQHSTGKRKKKKKKKKKKKRKKSGESTSDSNSEFVASQRDAGYDQTLLPRRQEELPDIIPKQDNYNKGKGAEERPGGRKSCSPLHSQSHPCSGKTSSHSRSRDRCRRSRTRSSSPTRGRRTRSRSPCTPPFKRKRVPGRRARTPPSPPEGQRRRRERTRTNQVTPADCGGSGGPQPSPRPEKPAKSSRLQGDAPDKPRSSSNAESPDRKKKKRSSSPKRDRERKSSKKRKKSKSPSRRSRRRSRSRSPAGKKRAWSRSSDRRSRRSRSSSRRRAVYSQRDRWKREPSHSPVLILRKNRSPSRKERSASPQRISELDKFQLLEIAKANAAAMCVKAGMPVPDSLRSTMLPLVLPNMAMNAAMASMTAATVTAALSSMGTVSSLLPSSSKPTSLLGQSNAVLEEAKKKVLKQANSISIKEFTDKCKMIVASTTELQVAVPHVSDDEDDDGKPFGGGGPAVREQKVINFNIANTSVRPGGRSDVSMAKEFPVSSGCQHRKKEGEGQAAYGEWVPVDRTADKAAAAAAAAAATALSKSQAGVSTVKPAAPPAETAAGPASPCAEPPAPVAESDNVFPEPPRQPVDITQAVTERINAQKRLAENPNDITALCMLTRAQEQVTCVWWKGQRSAREGLG